MTKHRLYTAVLTVAASSILATACRENAPTDLSTTMEESVQALPGRGVVFTRGAFDGTPTHSPTGVMTAHSGLVLGHSTTYAIFVGPSWNTNPSFTSDKISSLQTFFQGFGGSYYANTVTEYFAGTQSTYGGSFVDNGIPPNGNPSATYVATYVCNFLAPHGLSPDPYAVYNLYSTDAPYPISGGYALGWHAATTCAGVTIHYAIVFNMDGWGLVTDPQHYHSDNAAELVNTTAHELAETITDPSPGSGWFTLNTSGEIADKCNFEFGPSPYSTLANGAVFKLQGEWSNQAFQAGTGFVNANGEHGCVKAVIAPPSIAGPSTMSAGNVCNFTASASGGSAPYQYVWSYTLLNGASGGGWSPSNGTFTLAAQNSTGQVSLRVTATDANGIPGINTKLVNFGAGSCFS